MGPGCITKTLVMSLLAVVWITGCGLSAHEPSTRGNAHVNEPGSHQELKKLGIRNGRPAKGRSFCARANARRGRMPGIFEFTARCIGLAKGGPIDLAVVLDPGGGVNRGARIVWHRRILRVSGGGPDSHDGRCALNQQALECGAEATGRFSDTCKRTICVGARALYTLYSGRPRGC